MQPIFQNTPLPLLELAARFGEQRQDVLAGNVANIDTPGYRTRDLPVEEFQKALTQAMAARSSHAPPGHYGPSAPVSLQELFPETLFRANEINSGHVTFQDGNNRNIEREVMEMTKNSLMQNMVIELMSAQFQMLQAAISGRA